MTIVDDPQERYPQRPGVDEVAPVPTHQRVVPLVLTMRVPTVWFRDGRREGEKEDAKKNVIRKHKTVDCVVE